MPTLVIRHQPGTDPPLFAVSRSPEGKAAKPVAVAAPNSIRVAGRPNDDLTTQMQWYLEHFLDYPFHPDDEYAERVQKAIRDWGRQTFEGLFGSGSARDFYHDATREGLTKLTVRVVSDSPFILGWPWEALEDATSARLAHQCEIERHTEGQTDPPPLPPLPTDKLNVLLVIAPPMEGDVKYRSVSRSLVELAAAHTFPIAVDVLRPPTFRQLRTHLERHPNRYHILHFDGHGAYQAAPPPAVGGHALRAADGRLLFETDDGKEELVEAETLSELLKEHAVPAVVLNACQSAMIDSRAADPFASVAAALLKAGTRSVVAMAYALYVSGAQQFLPSFYRTLFETGRVAAAVRAGRRQMLQNKGRVCARGVFPLDDWLVPVLYQQEPVDLSFVQKASAAPPAESKLPEEARDSSPYGFVGRDNALLALERAAHRPPAGIRITGLGGIGKTTLAKGFLRWLEQTGGLGAGAVWFDFRGIRSAEFVLNQLGVQLTGKPEFATLPMPQKLDFLAKTCCTTPLWIVWDNFESARGIPGLLTGNLSDADAKLLKEFLAKLRGGKTKVLITSRSPEDWLEPVNAGLPVALGGLDGEDRWVFANAVLTDLGMKQDPLKPDPDVKALMDLLKGHPLAMRVMLTKLAKQSAAQLGAIIRANLAGLITEGTTEADAALAATLRFTTQQLPPAWQPVLILLGLHESYADAKLLEMMTKEVERGPSRVEIDACLDALSTGGLIRDLGQSIRELHPLLTSHLRAEHESVPANVRDGWTRAFADIMGGLADALAPRPLHEQRPHFALHEGNFHAARLAAERLDINTDYAAITQSLASFALNIHNYAAATTFFEQLQVCCVRSGDEKTLAGAYHQLGMIAHEQLDHVAAETWFNKSLEIHQRRGDENSVAKTYHVLGSIALGKHEYVTAEYWYQRSLAITEKSDETYTRPMTYHQLAIVAWRQRDFATAEKWCLQALVIYGKLGEEHEAADTYHQMGIIAGDRGDFATAEERYLQALAIYGKLGDEYKSGGSYHQLGMIAGNRGDFVTAEKRYLQALTIFEKLGDSHRAASTYYQLGTLQLNRSDFMSAWGWNLKALSVFLEFNDSHSASLPARSLVRVFREASPEIRPQLLARGREAGLPDEFLQAIEKAANSPPSES